MMKKFSISNKTRLLSLSFWVSILSLILASPMNVFSAGLLVADGGFGGILSIREHDVRVTINNGIAVTHVTQVFRNEENRQVEALYTFPVPKSATVSNFSMWIGGKEMIGEVIEKERAREIYNSYKRQRRDPGLLEQTNYKTFEMRIFPIAPNADQKVEITYYQEVDIDHDWGTYVYPLATASRSDIDPRVQGRFSINFDVLSAVPLAGIDSPSHGDEFVFDQSLTNHARASFEVVDGSLATDVVLSFQLKRARTGIDIITSKESGEDGFFLLTMTVGDDLSQLDTGMDYVFILDVSGSMANDGKLLLSRDAISAFINTLSRADRFEVMSFNVRPELAFNELRNSTSENKEAGLQFLSARQAKGGTELKSALLTAFKYVDSDRPLNLIILSDGMTEQHERQILLRSLKDRPTNSRVYCIGVGNEVNRPLLEQLADDTGGLSSFISRGDNFQRQAQAFRRKVTRPAVIDIDLQFGGGAVYDIVPDKVPNLYHGSPVKVYGRYRQSGVVELTLSGTILGSEFTKTETIDFPPSDLDNPEIDRMWALKKIDVLQKKTDRGGSRNDAVDEIIRLGEVYSIVTEYTSFLVLENDAEYRRWKIERKNVLRTTRDRNAQQRLQASLDTIRNHAVSAIGPLDREPQIQLVDSTSPATRTVSQDARNSSRNTNPSTSRRGFDFGDGFGSGPVGPLFVLYAFWLTIVKRIRRNS